MDFDDVAAQFIGLAIQIAGATGAYYREAIEQGFDEEQALNLAHNFQENVICASFEFGGGEGEAED